MNENPNDKLPPLTVSSLMRTMSAPDYPAHIVRLLNQVKSWLPSSFRLDGVDLPYWEVVREDPDRLFNELAWLCPLAALLPSVTAPPPQAEAVVLSLGEVDLTGAMRLAVDYSLIFSKNTCRRVWIVSDCWIYCDVAEYADHIRAMIESDISLRFVLVTPWGWVETPISALADRPSAPPSSDDGRGRNRRRRDDD